MGAENNNKDLSFSRDISKQLRCEFKGHEKDCTEKCDKCAFHIKGTADVAMSQKKLDEAIALYKKAIFIESHYADAWVCIGKSYMQKGDYNKSLDAFNRALGIDAIYGEALFNKAVVLQKIGHINEAINIVNDLLVSCDNAEVIALKQQLIDLGAKDVYQLDTAIEIMTNKALKIASQNNLLDKDGKVRTERAIYKKTEFASQIFDYCKRKHSLLGEEKVRSESIITAFYASLCTTLFYYKDKDGFENIHPFEYIKDHIDLEKADATAERMLEMKSGDAEVETLWNMIYDYAQFSGNIISKVEADDIEVAIIDATESAYVLGMLYAMRYFKKNNSTGRETIDAALAKLAESSKAYENPPPETAMCYSIRTPNEVDIKFTCDKCGKVTTLKVYEGHEGLIGDYQNLTAEFIKLGHNAEFLTLCDECAEQHFPSLSSWKKNNFVFVFTAEGSADSVCSFPSTWRYGDFEYRIALSFLNGADTIEKLAAITETRLNADVYLKHVESVIGSTKNKG